MILAALLLVLSACGAPQPAPAQPSPTAEALPAIAAATSAPTSPTGTATSTSAPPFPTATPSLQPVTSTPTPTAAPTLTATATLAPATLAPATLAPPTPSGKDAIYIFYVQSQSGQDNGSQKKGEGKGSSQPKGASGGTLCGDTLVAINTGLPRSGDTAADITNALKRLFSKVKGSGSLVNPAYLSNIEVVKVDFAAFLGVVDVDLAGTYVRTGDHCDDYRVREQVWTTIRQFEGVKTVNVLLNGNLLGDILAGGK